MIWKYCYYNFNNVLMMYCIGVSLNRRMVLSWITTTPPKRNSLCALRLNQQHFFPSISSTRKDSDIITRTNQCIPSYFVKGSYNQQHIRSARWMSTSIPNDDDNNNEPKEDTTKNKKDRKVTTTKKYKTTTKKKKYQVNNDVSDQHHMDQLAKVFDELARKDGFDSSMAFYADDKTFEDKISDDEFDFDKLDDEDDDIIIDGDNNDDDDDDDYLDFGSDDINNEDDDMESRIMAAKRDIGRGRVSVPKELDDFVTDVTTEDLRRLGFRREVNPFGIDETPRKEQFVLITDAMKCTACGSDFQSSNEQRPGYLPPDKYDIQVQLSKIESIQNLQQKLDSNDWTPEDEVEWLIQSANKNPSERDVNSIQTIDIDAMADDLGLDLVTLSQKKTICKRCHSLQNFGQVDVALRPGWTQEPLLSQETFQNLLKPLSKKPAVIIALVDIFDFSGSVLPELDSIAGDDNPVILAANKADLLPTQMGQTRVETWVRRELEYIGIRSLANIGGAVRLISCKTGMGVEAMLAKARRLAEEINCDIYIVGAANSGKSTLMNRILADYRSPSDNKSTIDGKIRAGNRNKIKDAITTSPLPGTTLKFISVDLGGGRKLYDTPGLLVPGTLTQLLTPEELKIVVPKHRVEPVTFRLASGKCVLVGGLAKIELINDSKPFLFTFFVANAIKLHPTDSSKADEFIEKHVGTMLTPPLPPGPERYKELGEFEDHIITIDGNGWKVAAADITLTGLGWVAITGAGTATVKVSVPKGIGVELRPPLMPFDVWETTAKYTGSRSVRKSTKTSSGKRRKGVGRN